MAFFLLHRFKSYRGNYSREETICRNTVYFLCIIEPSANRHIGSVVVNIIRLYCDWSKYLQKDKISVVLSCTGTLEGNQMVLT